MLMFNTPLTVEQRMQKALVDILSFDEFIALSGVLMVGTRTLTDNPEVPTARTNGRDEEYNRDFVATLTNPELRFLILHEAFHKMYLHLSTWQALYAQDADRTNWACDYVINIKLADTDACKRGDIAMPAQGLLDPQYRGMNVAQVFARLPKGTGANSRGTSGGSLDSHDWERAKGMSAHEAEELAKQIDDAVRQGRLAAQKLKRGDPRLTDELVETKQDWRELMREFMTTAQRGDIATWRRVNRRYVGYDILMPGTITERVGDVVVAIDTSGSIGADDLAVFLGEVKGICEQVRPERVHMLYWDTGVVRHETYDSADLHTLVDSTKPAGGGGTDVTCVPEYLRARNITAECAVILTDGYLGGTWGVWAIPTLWVIKDNTHATSDVGVTIHL